MVSIARIKDATRVVGKDQEEYLQLPIRDVEIDGVPAMISAWEFSPKEVAAIKAGVKLYIFIGGKIHPPIRVYVGKLP